MFNWLKDLFKPKLGSTEYLYKPAAYEPKISEPVLSFIKLIKSNPRRFNVSATLATTLNCRVTYRVKDKLNNLQFLITGPNVRYCNGWGLTSEWHERGENCSFLTNDECDFLITEITKVYSERYTKLQNIKKQRQRKNLTKIYGEVK